MRNLKKILAMALAMVMTFSVMATASAFSDQEDISETYSDAVTVLSGLGVFEGDDRDGDGVNEFRAKDPITRAEVAAILYRLATGDVDNIQAKAYAGHADFDDLAGAEWADGYIGYCYNAQYILGYNGKFRPGENIDGYAVLAMVLRALGYDQEGEFQGEGWEIRTASKARELGILKNVSSNDDVVLSQYATRELVAELLFQASLVDTVEWTMLNRYTETGESLGYKVFGLEEIEGVVVANEYADLYAPTTQRTGKTEMLVDGKSYVLDYASTLDDIGESRIAYVTGAGDKVLALGDTGDNMTYETTDKVSINTTARFESVTGLREGDAEEYINFGLNAYIGNDVLIRYVLDMDSLTLAQQASVTDLVSAINNINLASISSNTFTRTIRPGENTVLQADLNWIKEIFYSADLTEAQQQNDKDEYVKGEVYVGTQSTDDISDDRKVSYQSFEDEYIIFSEDASVNSNENGNWLKVIDNDGDGEADYILKTIYTFAQVTRVKDDVVTLDVKDETLDSTDDVNELGSEDVVCESELAVGDVVYYALIDGNAYAWLADVVTAKIDKVNRNTLTATTTDGEEFIQSGVHSHIEDAEFESGVTNLGGTYTYDLYLDRGGFLGAFAQTETAQNYTLLTDAWYNSTKTGDEYAVKAYIDGAQEIVDITKNGSLFITSSGALNNDWGAMKELGNVDYELNWEDGTLRTAVASLNDGVLTPVDQVYNKKEVRMIATNGNVIPRQSYVGGVSYTTGMSARNAYNWLCVDDEENPEVEIRGLSTTTYYLVYPNSRGAIQVEEITGYSKLPSTLVNDGSDVQYIEDVYAVGTLTERTSGLGADTYYTADVVVIELSQKYKTSGEQIFIYDVPEVGAGVTIENVGVIRADGTMDTVSVDLSKSDGGRIYLPAYGKYLNPGLYFMYESDTEGVYTVERMDQEDIRANRYTTGWVATEDGTVNWDYLEVQAFSYVDEYSYEDTLIDGSTPEYRLTDDSNIYSLSYRNWGVDGSYWNNYVPTLTAYEDGDELGDFLSERVDVSTTTSKNRLNTDYNVAGDAIRWWNNNDVLVKYDSSGNVIYAISFANLTSNDGQNFAQDVWNSVKPAPAAAKSDTAEPIVTINGARVYDGDTLVLSYLEYVALGDDKEVEVVVTPATGNTIAIDGITTFTTEVVKFDLALAAAAGSTVSFDVVSQGDAAAAVTRTYTYAVEWADDTLDTGLKKLPSTDLTPNAMRTDDMPTGTTLTLIKDGKTYYEAEGIAEWKFFDINGNEIVDMSTLVGEGLFARVVVKDNKGNSNVYYIDAGDDPTTGAALAKAILSQHEDAVEAVEELRAVKNGNNAHTIGVFVPVMVNAVDENGNKKWTTDEIVGAVMDVVIISEGVPMAVVQTLADALQAAGVADNVIAEAVFDHMLADFNTWLNPVGFKAVVAANDVTLETADTATSTSWNANLGIALQALIDAGCVSNYDAKWNSVYNGVTSADSVITGSSNPFEVGNNWNIMLGATLPTGTMPGSVWSGTLTLNLADSSTDVEYTFTVK